MNLVSDANFAGLANTSAVSAGAQIGATGLVDVVGGKATIASGKLVVDGSDFYHAWVVRPAAEAAVNQQVVGYFLGSDNPTPLLFLRVRANYSQAYSFFSSAGTLYITNLTAVGGNSILASGGTFSYNAANTYILTASATKNGSATDLSLSIAESTAPTTVLGSLSVSDSTASLQAAGTYAWSAGNNGSTGKFTRVQTYSGDVVPTIKAVFHGDSLTVGYNSTSPGGTATPRLATVLAGVGPTAIAVNAGNNGHSLSQMITELGSTVNALYDATKPFNVLVVQGGHNDFYASATVADVIGRIKSYVQTALAAHPWLIVWCTEPPAAFTGYPANFNTLREQANAWLRANWRSLGIAALSDIALDARIGMTGAQTNTTYFSAADLTHLTDAGYTIWGQYDLAAIQLVLGSGSLSTPGIGTYTRTITVPFDAAATGLSGQISGIAYDTAGQTIVAASNVIEIGSTGVYQLSYLLPVLSSGTLKVTAPSGYDDCYFGFGQQLVEPDNANIGIIASKLPAGLIASEANATTNRDTLSAAIGSISNTSGTGARTVTLTINDGTSALQGARVRLTKAAESYVATTDTNGHAVFGVNDGDWLVAITLNGFMFTPTTLTVAANVSHTYSMTLIAIASPALPNQSTGLLTTCDASGAAAAGVVVTFSMLAGPGADGNSFSDDTVDATSDSNGLLAIPLVRGATYQAQRGDGQAEEFPVPDEDSFKLPEILGRAS